MSIGPYSVIGPDVEIGEGCWIGPHVVINGPTRIGRENKIFQFASIGEVPQDLKFHGEPSVLEIGDRNTFRESCTVHRGTEDGGNITRIGDDNLFMAYVHVAHDCIIANKVILSNNASLAGHVHIGDHAILSGFSMIHQFSVIGAHSFVGMGSAVTKDVPPFVVANGEPAEPRGLNLEGMKRRGFTEGQQRSIKNLYKLLYRKGLKLEEAKREIDLLASDDDMAVLFSDFLSRSTRSIVR